MPLLASLPANELISQQDGSFLTGCMSVWVSLSLRLLDLETRRRHEEIKTKTGQNTDDGEEAEKEALGRGEWGIKERVGVDKRGKRMRKERGNKRGVETIL